MKLTRIVVAALAALALVTGAGAVAAAPDNAQASENAQAGQAGPPSDLPNPVPDFVGDIHEQITGFVDGTVENLGSAVSDLTPGDGETPAPADEGGD